MSSSWRRGRDRTRCWRRCRISAAFFAVIDKPPVDVSTADVLEFIAEQRRPRGDGRMVRLSDGESGMSARTIKRRLSSMSGLYSFLVMVGETSANPVPRGLATRRTRGRRGLPLIRTPRLLPKILEPGEVDALIGALRALARPGHGRSDAPRWSAPLRSVGVAVRRPACWRAAGVHRRRQGRPSTVDPDLDAVLPQPGPLLGTRTSRPTHDPKQVFVVLKGPRRGRPLTADGLDEIVCGARRRAGLTHGTCHELRHTCLTRLREAGMALEAVQAQAGHRSIESTRIYLHLSNDWLAGEYLHRHERIDGSVFEAVTR